MSRAEYIEMRTTGRYNYDAFYRYYINKRDNKIRTLPPDLFSQAFGMYFQINANTVIEHLDIEFKVSKLEDAQGNLLQIH